MSSNILSNIRESKKKGGGKKKIKRVLDKK